MSESIRRLSYREQAREKISIWYGSADNYEHGLKEVMANATDEIINNFDSGEIYVELSEDGKRITVRDTGRGIPMNGVTDGTNNYELLFKIPFAGTKYGEMGTMDGSYTGSNGSGSTILNYTSTLFEVTSVRSGKEYHLRFENGGELTKDITEKKTDKQSGTTVTFELDPEVYTKVDFSSEQVKDIIRRYAVSTPKITIHYKHGEEECKIHYEDLEEYYNEVIKDYSTSPIKYAKSARFDDSGEDTSLELVISTTTEVVQESYLNLNYMPNGGTINNGILNGFKLYMNKYCRDNNLFPKNVKSFSDNDIMESLSFVAVMLSNKVEFENQTKFSTQKKLYFEVAKKRVSQMLEVMEIEDRKGFESMVKHILLVQKDNTSNQRQKEKLKKELEKKVDSINNRIDGLVDCRIHGEEAELYLAEGDSAHGSIVLSRDGKFQASLSMGGKILNVMKNDSLEAITKNEKVMNVIKAIGAGANFGKKQKGISEFDVSKMRYGKIICASDSDADGGHINSLTINLFSQLMPDVITSGRLYIAQTPLYELKLKNDKVVYIFTESERDSTVEKYKDETLSISRAKGLGQLEPTVLAETAMNPDSRRLIRVVMEDVDKSKQTLVNWMGKEVDERKIFIESNLNRYLEGALD